jgi:hypothetical protein
VQTLLCTIIRFFATMNHRQVVWRSDIIYDTMRKNLFLYAYFTKRTDGFIVTVMNKKKRNLGPTPTIKYYFHLSNVNRIIMWNVKIMMYYMKTWFFSDFRFLFAGLYRDNVMSHMLCIIIFLDTFWFCNVGVRIKVFHMYKNISFKRHNSISEIYLKLLELYYILFSI